MSYRSSFARRDTGRETVYWSCAAAARQWAFRMTSGQMWSIFLVLVTSFSLVSSAQSATQNETTQTPNRQALNTDIFNTAVASLNGVKIRTGIVYNATLGTNITDQSVELVQMIRLRSGSFKRYGLQFNEITFPKGVEVTPTVLRVLLVYRRFREYAFYNTSGDIFATSVVGVLAYDATDITNNAGGSNLSVITVVTTGLPILVHLTSSTNAGLNDVKCVMYNNTIDGTSMGALQNYSSSCAWTTLGDYSLLAPRVKKSSNTWKIVLGSVIGGIVLFVLLVLLVFLCVWYREKARFQNMEKKSEQGETLSHTLVGGSRAPSAASTRTKPRLENDYSS